MVDHRATKVWNSVRAPLVLIAGLVGCAFLICVALPANAKRRADPTKMLTFWKASFANELSASQAVRDECHMEDLLNSYLKSNAPERGASIQFAESEAHFAQSPNQLYVSIADVDSKEWRFPRTTPSSLVTFDIKIVIDGQIVKQVRKDIRSGGGLFGFGVCQRVDKIAKAGGAFAAEWVARADYRTVEKRTLSNGSQEESGTQQQAKAPVASSASETQSTVVVDGPAKRLEQLEALKSKNLITQEEYEAKRSSILDSI